MFQPHDTSHKQKPGWYLIRGRGGFESDGCVFISWVSHSSYLLISASVPWDWRCLLPPQSDGERRVQEQMQVRETSVTLCVNETWLCVKMLHDSQAAVWRRGSSTWWRLSRSACRRHCSIFTFHPHISQGNISSGYHLSLLSHHHFFYLLKIPPTLSFLLYLFYL